MISRLFTIIAAGLLLYGCAAPGLGTSEQSWNAWIGTTKDERVRDQGIPTRCHTFKSGDEACEWPIRWAPDSLGSITIIFDRKGTACQWLYKDAYSERRSTQQCP